MLVHLLLQLAYALGDLGRRPQLVGLLTRALLRHLGSAPLVVPAAGYHCTFKDLLHALDHTLGRNAMLLVECDLPGPPALGLADGPLHGTGDPICIEDGLAVQVTRRAADGLDRKSL